MKLVTKSEFARLAKVDRSAVSHWIKTGILTGAALVGEGAKAKINVDVGLRQVAVRRDVGQTTGNGAATHVFQKAASEAALAEHGECLSDGEAGEPGLSGAVSGDTQERIAQERLKEIERRNRQGDEEEAERRGMYTLTAEATRAMNGIAVQMMRAFDGMIPDMATAVASHFKLDQRDVTHVLQVASLGARERAFEKASAKAATLPQMRDPDASA